MSSKADKEKAAGGKPVSVGPLACKLGYVLRRAQLAVFDDFIAALAEVELRPAQYAVLVLLAYTPGLKQSDAAVALGIQCANFVALVDGLGRRRLARRCLAPKDRRSYALYLTEFDRGRRGVARACRPA